jgi:hypothetical protein
LDYNGGKLQSIHRRHWQRNKAYCGWIRTKIPSAGIVTNRTPELNITKIYELVNSYKQAHHIKSQTSESMENVYAACKYFDVLDPILGSRPSVQPCVMNKIIAAGNHLRTIHQQNQLACCQLVMMK